MDAADARTKASESGRMRKNATMRKRRVTTCFQHRHQTPAHESRALPKRAQARAFCFFHGPSAPSPRHDRSTASRSFYPKKRPAPHAHTPTLSRSLSQPPLLPLTLKHKKTPTLDYPGIFPALKRIRRRHGRMYSCESKHPCSTYMQLTRSTK